jgi:serine protease Do
MLVSSLRYVLGGQEMGRIGVTMVHWYRGVIINVCIAAILATSLARGSAQSPFDELKQLEQRIAELLPKIQPTVVCIESGNGSGSGVIVSQDGLVLTAAHVMDHGNEITVVYPDGRRFRAKALGLLGIADAGMVQMTEGAPHPFAEVASGKEIQRDDVVLAMGHPSGFDEQRGPPLRIGHVLKCNENFMEIDNSLIGGDSGGPSFDLQGRVIGIHSHISPTQIYSNVDSSIVAFHAHWDAMLAGEKLTGPFDKFQNGSDSAVEESHGKTEENTGDASISEDRSKSKLQEYQQEAKEQGGRIKLSREALRELRAGIANRTEALAPSGGSRIKDSWSTQWIEAFRTPGSQLSASVHRVFVNDRCRAMATAVDESGLLVTKLSEVKGKAFEVEVSPNKRRAGQVVHSDNTLDLAIVQVDHVSLRPIDFHNTESEVAKGRLCAAVNASNQVAGFGTVSVASRPLDGKSGAFLGAQCESVLGGIRVTSVKPKSPAEQAGIQVNDLLTAVENEPLMTQKQLMDQVQVHLPGEVLRFDVKRDETYLSLAVKLGDGAKLAPMPGSREQGTDSMSTMMSKRRWYFAQGIQHDCSIAPQDCGGPLIGLDGKVLGINIARAGRIQSYAIPIGLVQRMVADFRKGVMP